MLMTDYPKIKEKNLIENLMVENGVAKLKYKIYHYLSGETEIIEELINLEELVKTKESVSKNVNELLSNLEGIDLLIKDIQSKIIS